MKHENWVRFSVAATTLMLITACGGDKHGGASVPRQATFVGLWMSDSAHRDVQKVIGDGPAFCRVVSAAPARHGLTATTNQRLPKVQIIEVVNGGLVYQWSPALFSSSDAVINEATVGRIDSAGKAAMAGFGGGSLGMLRFTDFDHLVQIDGVDMFADNLASTRRARPSSTEYGDYARGADGKRGFTRVDRGFAEAYVNQLVACAPNLFPGARGAAPVTRETLPPVPAVRESTPVPPPRNTGTRANPKNSWDEDATPAPAPTRTAPSAPSRKAPVKPAPDRGHTQGNIGPVPGHIDDDDDNN